MGLSINKLIRLLEEKDFIPQKFYKIYGIIAFIEIISLKNAEKYMLYIPSKYEFSDTKIGDSYKLKVLDFSDKDGNIEDYTGEPNIDDIEKSYNEIDIEDSLVDGEDMKKKLLEKYKKLINLRDLNEKDNFEIKAIFRQLKRFKYCVQNLNYKLIILFKSYLCVLHIDDSIECFYIKDYPEVDEKQFLITFDLESFYKNLNVIDKELVQVRKGIQKVLDKNQGYHIKSLEKMLEKRKDIHAISKEVSYKKTECLDHIHNFQKLIESISDSEIELNGKITELENKRERESSIRGMYGDIEYSHEKQKIRKELKELHVLKNETMDNILLLKLNLNNLLLSSDKILFDNIIMLDKIFLNIDNLSKLSRN